jgi:transposase-like protein
MRDFAQTAEPSGEGAVSLTGGVLRSVNARAGEPVIWCKGARYASSFVQASPVPGRGHPLCGLALFSLHPQLPRRRGIAGPAWIEVSNETIRCWTIKFGPQIARNLKRRRPSPSPRWHLDEMVCNVGGKRMYLWRAVDDEGEVLDLVMQRRRDTAAALKLLKRLLRNQPVAPVSITTNGLSSYTAALRALGLLDLHRPGRLRENNRAENSHLPVRRRERKMQGFNSRPRLSVSSAATRRSTTPFISSPI